MNKSKLLITALLLLSSLAHAENKEKNLTFDDAKGNKITCSIDSNGQSLCTNSNRESVICANSDNGYTCSAN